MIASWAACLCGENGYKTKTKMPDTVLGVALIQITLHLNTVKEFTVPKNCKQNKMVLKNISS